MGAIFAAACSSDDTDSTATEDDSSGSGEDGGSAVTDYVDYTHGTEGAADSSLSPVTIGWVNQQGGSLEFPNATAGAEAAVEYINENLGGIGGHPLELSTCFVASSEDEGNRCGQQMVNDSSVQMVLYGSLLTGNQAFQSVVQGQKPILIGNSIAESDATADNVYIYNGNPSSIFGGLATYLGDVLGAQNVSVLYPEDAQTTAGVQTLEAMLDELGVEHNAVGFDPSATDLTAPAVAADVQTADAVVTLVSSPNLCIASANALSSLGVQSPVVAAGSFCFSSAVAEGLGGEAPLWQQLSVQSNVADTSQPDVEAYGEAASAAGLEESAQRDSDAAMAWGLVMTAARFLNDAGGADATADSIAESAGAFTGPMLLGGPTIECGKYSSAPALCAAETRVFEHTGGGQFEAVSDWLQPTGIE